MPCRRARAALARGAAPSGGRTVCSSGRGARAPPQREWAGGGRGAASAAAAAKCSPTVASGNGAGRATARSAGWTGAAPPAPPTARAAAPRSAARRPLPWTPRARCAWDDSYYRLDLPDPFSPSHSPKRRRSIWFRAPPGTPAIPRGAGGRNRRAGAPLTRARGTRGRGRVVAAARARARAAWRRRRRCRAMAAAGLCYVCYSTQLSLRDGVMVCDVCGTQAQVGAARGGAPRVLARRRPPHPPDRRTRSPTPPNPSHFGAPRAGRDRGAGVPAGRRRCTRQEEDPGAPREGRGGPRCGTRALAAGGLARRGIGAARTEPSVLPPTNPPFLPHPRAAAPAGDVDAGDHGGHRQL
jgi:hypothetical protein